MKRATRKLATPEELEKFQQFLFEMDDVLEAFIAEARAAGFGLDYTLDSTALL